MKQVKEMPTSGQFVAVWQCHDGDIDSAILKYGDTGLLLTLIDYSEGTTKWVEDVPQFYTNMKAVYFVAS